MSTQINNFGTVNYHDNHKEITINGATNAAEIVRAFMADEAEDVEPVPQNNPTTCFRYITQKCINEKRVEKVEAEINAACKGTAEALWRTLWDNENMGYVETQHVDATTLYRDLESRFGKLPYKERNFREARNKR